MKIGTAIAAGLTSAAGSLRDPAVAPAQATTPSQGSPGAQRAGAAPAGPSPFAIVVRDLGREVERGESLVRSAIGASRGAGGTMGPGELIALQAGVYRYGEAVDLASRLVDRATTSVKTVLQGQ
jgi:hypothetical protein